MHTRTFLRAPKNRLAIRRRTARTAITLSIAAALVASAPLAASAHVRIDPDQATPGSYAYITFRVPSESATAGTVGLEVDFPTDTPFSSVSYQAVPGWSTVVTTATLPQPVKTSTGTITTGVTKVVWTADAGVEVPPGQFQQFTVSAGAVPDTGDVLLPAIQTYSDGSVVSWTDKPNPDGTEPQHPAPVLYIEDTPPTTTDAGSPSVTSAPVASGSGTSGSGASSASSTSSASEGVSLGLGIGGLGLGVIALIVAVLAFTRANRAGVRGQSVTIPPATDAGRSRAPEAEE